MRWLISKEAIAFITFIDTMHEQGHHRPYDYDTAFSIDAKMIAVFIECWWHSLFSILLHLPKSIILSSFLMFYRYDNSHAFNDIAIGKMLFSDERVCAVRYGLRT